MVVTGFSRTPGPAGNPLVSGNPCRPSSPAGAGRANAGPGNPVAPGRPSLALGALSKGGQGAPNEPGSPAPAPVAPPKGGGLSDILNNRKQRKLNNDAYSSARITMHCVV